MSAPLALREVRDIAKWLDLDPYLLPWFETMTRQNAQIEWLRERAEKGPACMGNCNGCPRPLGVAKELCELGRWLRGDEEGE